jgi:hypothetical protein
MTVERKQAADDFRWRINADAATRTGILLVRRLR